MEKDILQMNKKRQIAQAFDSIDRYSNFLKLSLLIPQSDSAECNLLMFQEVGSRMYVCFLCIVSKIQRGSIIKANKITFNGKLGEKTGVLKLMEYLFCSECKRCMLFSTDINYRKQCFSTVTKYFDSPDQQSLIGVALNYYKSKYPNNYTNEWTDDVTLKTELLDQYDLLNIQVKVFSNVNADKYRFIINHVLVITMTYVKYSNCFFSMFNTAVFSVNE